MERAFTKHTFTQIKTGVDVRNNLIAAADQTSSPTPSPTMKPTTAPSKYPTRTPTTGRPTRKPPTRDSGGGGGTETDAPKPNLKKDPVPKTMKMNCNGGCPSEEEIIQALPENWEVEDVVVSNCKNNTVTVTSCDVTMKIKNDDGVLEEFDDINTFVRMENVQFAKGNPSPGGGNGAVVAVVVILMLGLLAAGGYYVYKKDMHVKYVERIKSMASSRGGGGDNETSGGGIQLKKVNVKLSKAPSSKLPKDWKEYNDKATGRPYYYNTKTKETSWVKPTAALSCSNETLQLANSPKTHRKK